jgi:hypothetical protein
MELTKFETMSGGARQISSANRASVPCRWHVYLACTALALACNYLLGKDMAWDTLNYHLYLGFSALNDRFKQDYFAAGFLAYLNPYAYAPFYAMVRAGLPALVIGSIFAIAHSIILWLVFELGVSVCPSQNGSTRLLWGVCSVALAFMNPVLIQQVGSCFADITTAEVALGGWLLLAGAVRAPHNSKVISAGLLLGAASALKLSNALSAVSALAMLAMLPLGWRGKVRHALLFSISLGIGFSIVAGPWAYRLAQQFGNPFFPMFNSIFRSPEFTTESMGATYRFIPESIGAALWRPFAMIDPVRNVHEELSAPDPRYAILFVLVILWSLRWGWIRAGRASPPPNVGDSKTNESTRILAALSCGLAVNWILWLYVSGNSRYGLPMACVAAVVIAGMLFRLFEPWPKVRNYLLAIIFAIQAVQLCMGAEYRWTGIPWNGGQWFDVSVPDSLRTQSNVYLTLGVQSNSFLAPFLAKGSGLINLTGGYTLDPEGANGVRVRELIRRFEPNVRVAFLTYRPFENPQRGPPTQSVLQWYGLRPDLTDCATIVVHGAPPEFPPNQDSLPLGSDKSEPTTYVETCRAVSDTTELAVLKARQRAADLVFDRLEDACPRLFSPRRQISVSNGDSWRRRYGGTDIVVSISHGRVTLTDHMRPYGPVDVGSESDWAKAPMRLECGKRDGIYFAHVLAASQ